MKKGVIGFYTYHPLSFQPHYLLRRSFSYIHSSRIEQIEMELNLYYYERGIEPPSALLRERFELQGHDDCEVVSAAG